MSEKVTGNIVQYNPDPAHPVKIDPERLARLKAMTEDEIDYSDAPAAPSDGWRKAGYVRSSETPDQVVLDKDVLQFFSETGDASPQRINAVLREYVEAQRKTA